MTGGESLAEIRIRAEVQRCLALFVLQLQIGTVCRKEARDEGAALLVLTLCAQAHQQPSDVLHVLQLPQLRQRMMSKGLVQRRVAILIGDIQIRAFAN